MDLNIKNNIQAKRKSLHLTRPALAEKVGVTWETIKAYETKGTVPSLPIALKLSIVLEEPLDGLFSAEVVEQFSQTEETDLSQ